MDKERIKRISENATARAVLIFNQEVEKRFTEIQDDNWAYRRLTAFQESLPSLIRTALSVALEEMALDRGKDY